MKMLLRMVLAMVVCTPAFGADIRAVYQDVLVHEAGLQVIMQGQLIAQEQERQSKALFRPFISLRGELNRQRQQIASSSSALFPTDTAYFGSTGIALNLSQNIYHRSNNKTMLQARQGTELSDLRYKEALQILIFNTAVAYFNVLAAQDVVAFATSEQTAIDRQLAQAQQRYEVGLIAVTDVHESQARFDLARSQLIVAENQLFSSKDNLWRISGKMYAHIVPLGDQIPFDNEQLEDEKYWYEHAGDNLSTLILKKQLLMQRHAIDGQRGERYPVINLLASHRYGDISGGNFGGRSSYDSSIGLELRMPLYQGGALSSKIRVEELRYQQLRLQVQDNQREVSRLVRAAVRDVRAANNQVQALGQALVSSNSALQAIQAGFDLGTRTSVDVLNARRELFRVKRDLAAARYAYVLALLQLKLSVGALDAADLDQISLWLQPAAAQTE